MVKGLLKRFLFYTIALYTTTLVLSGVRVTGGVQTYIATGIALSLLMLLLKPVLQIVSIPINFLTFGLFSFLINAIILFIATIFFPQLSIQAFVFPHLSFFGFETPAVPLIRWFAISLASFVLSGVYSLLTWVTTE